jgi:hypothetical protein
VKGRKLADVVMRLIMAAVVVFTPLPVAAYAYLATSLLSLPLGPDGQHVALSIPLEKMVETWGWIALVWSMLSFMILGVTVFKAWRKPQ